MMPSFSLAALTVLELAPPALIDVAAAYGYDHVGIRLLPAVPGGIAYPLMEDEASLRETIARFGGCKSSSPACAQRSQECDGGGRKQTLIAVRLVSVRRGKA